MYLQAFSVDWFSNSAHFLGWVMLINSEADSTQTEVEGAFD